MSKQVTRGKMRDTTRALTVMLTTPPNVFDDTLSRCKNPRAVLLGGIALVFSSSRCRHAAMPWLILYALEGDFFFFSEVELRGASASSVFFVHVRCDL